jgi:hypothetical protein
MIYSLYPIDLRRVCLLSCVWGQIGKVGSRRCTIEDNDRTTFGIRYDLLFSYLLLAQFECVYFKYKVNPFFSILLFFTNCNQVSDRTYLSIDRFIYSMI